MQNTENTIYFNFSYSALKLLGKGQYSNQWTAIAELVANGLDAQARNIKIYINMIDKKTSVIEIFDDGIGMDYSDLTSKYALIGKDKRKDSELTDKIKNQVMGRKGIGKLAALYLSDKYYLISKTERQGESVWCLDATNAKDSDMPCLDRCNINDVGVECSDEWRQFDTGTLIHLTNVDFTNFGIKTLEGLKARLADFYLTELLDGQIEVCVVSSENDKKLFHKIEKSVAFRNFYAFYNNTDIDFENRLSEGVKIVTSFDSVTDIQRPVIRIASNQFKVSGKQFFRKENGELTNEELEYVMTGWIGIHTSIDKTDAVLNDPNFLKNKAYRPNQLRLYVRKKLAVENFLEYIKNTQAFSNYIEGEISFDILDDNKLGDIATSNRQGFVEDDERIILLVDILKPIINYLIKLRIKIANEIKEEIEAKRNEEIEKRKQAELIARKAEEERLEEEKKRKQAEQARRSAEEKQRQAEEKVYKEINRSKYILNVSGLEDKNIMNSIHSIYNMSNRVKENLDDLKNIINLSTAGMKKLEKAAMSNQRILSVSKIISKAGRIIDNNDALKAVNLGHFLQEYVNDVLCHIYDKNDIAINCEIITENSYIKKIKPLSFIMMIDNIIGNAIKAHANEMRIVICKTEDGKFAIKFIDDGVGLDKSIDNLDRLFEFGVTTTDGSGLGLFYAQKHMKELKGSIEIIPNKDRGITVLLKFD